MSKVFNWHINREMDFPYIEERPQKQFAMIMDTNKCIACQTCTIHCKQTWTWAKGQEYILWNNVESKPFGFYPIGWDVKLMEGLGSQTWDGDRYTGETIFEKGTAADTMFNWLPESDDWSYPNLGEDEPSKVIGATTYIPGLPHGTWSFYLARICNHCTYPACLAACPRKAIYKRPEDGIVLIDQSRCRGYRECVRACPYKKSMFDNTTRISVKCIACYPAVGKGFQNQCVTACIGRIRLTGFLSPPGDTDEENPVDFLVKVKKLAQPLYPQSGTEPNVYYIPPINVPAAFLGQMFGPAARDAVKSYRAASEDKKLLGLLMLFGSTDRIIFKFRIKKDRAYAYDLQGKEIVSVPIKEPTFIRPYRDRRYGSYRLNIT